MIIIRYLVREILKSQLAILFILLLIFFCQKMVRILGEAVNGVIPTDLVLTLLGLGIPDMAQLILPLSLFLAILMTLGKLYTESEITVMYACGLGKSVLIKASMLVMFITALLAILNVVWASPWSAHQQKKVTDNAQTNLSAAALAAGKFRTTADGNYVLFIGQVKGNSFYNIFLAQLRPKNTTRPSVIVADHGKMIQKEDGSQVVILYNGTRFEGTALLQDYRITDFTGYQALIGHKSTIMDTNDVSQASFYTLWHSSQSESQAELHWRLTLIISVFIMGLMVVPLSAVNPRQGRVVSMLPAILLYLVFFLLQSSLRSNGSVGRVDPALSMWTVNLLYLALAIGLNIWDTLPVRQFRARFDRKGVA